MNKSNTASKPVIMMLVSGKHALSKMKQLIGHRNPNKENTNSNSNSLRSFYGTDRFDNAYFLSETINESDIEQEFLFS